MGNCFKSADNEGNDAGENKGLIIPNTYIGGRNKKNERDGWGTYYFENGDSYAGDWKNGEMHGAGTYICKDGKE